MPSANVRIAQKLYEAINSRDFDAGFGLAVPDFEWRVPDRAILAGTYRGREEVERVINAQLEVFDYFEIVPEEFFEECDRLAVFVRQRARGGVSGAEVEIRIGHLWTFRDGKAVSLQVYPEREKALEALGRPGGI